MTNIEEKVRLSEQRLSKAALLYNKLSIDLKYLKGEKVKIKAIKKDYRDLSEYYEKYWVKDVEVVKDLNTHKNSYKDILNQDSLWNLIVALDRILKSKS